MLTGLHKQFGRLSEERGSAFVAAGIMAVSFVLLGAVIVQVGQWLVHRRHIQARADAAALAGGQALADCFNLNVNGNTEATLDSRIESWAKSYGGIAGGAAAGTGSPYNKQFGTANANLMSFQSNNYPSTSNPNPGASVGLDGRSPADSHECADSKNNANLWLDVKMSQQGISPIFSGAPFGFLATVHGWARVQLQQIKSLTPTLPLAIPDVRPKQVAVTFVDQSTGNALSGCPNGCVFQLGGPTQSGQLNDWGANVTIPMPLADHNVGMRVGIGSQVGTCAHVNATGTYTCYDYGGTGGIVTLRSYSSTANGTQSAPVLRAVTPTTCSNAPFFSTFQATGGSCSAGVTATVDFGASGPPAGAVVQATINNTTLAMTRTAGTNTWVSSATTLQIGNGPYPVTMAYCLSSCTGKRPTFVNFNGGNPVGQVYSGGDNSSPTLPAGPVFAAQVLDTNPADPNPGAYSFPQSQSVTLAVTVGLAGGVHLPIRCFNGTSGKNYNCPTDPPVLLRFTKTAGNDSHSYSIDCGGGPNIKSQIINGCTDPYSLNIPDVCPDPANPNPTDCADIQTGGAVGQIRQGMNTRFATPTCLPNNYPSVPDPATDHRAVTLVITDFSAFTGAGNGQVPVVTFATFYITGWDGADSSCNSQNEPAPAGAGNGDLWGHYIADVNLGAIPNGAVCVGPGQQPGVTPCAIALTR